MHASLIGSVVPAARRGWRRWPASDLGGAMLVACAALLVAYALATGQTKLALGVALLPLVLCELTRLSAAVVALGLSLPALGSIAGGSVSLNVALSDVLLAFVGAGIVLQALVTRSAPALRALRPVALPVAQYSILMVILLAFHLGLAEAVKTAQRFELVVLPLLIGAFAVLTGRHVRMLQAYVLAATFLAAVWPLNHLGMQKNPVGQLLCNAILLIVALRPLRSLAPCALVLAPGLLLTQSRGAAMALVIGLVIVAGTHASRGRMLVTRAVPLVVVVVVAFAAMPAALQARLTTFSPGAESASAYSIQIRRDYTADARRIIRAHPWTGIGVGSYLAGDTTAGTQARDPHQVLLLQAAEGGYGLAASFVFLVAACALALYRMRSSEVASAAAAVLVATVAHGFVDVYWVRGTPVLGWLLVGMACGVFADRERLRAAPEHA